MELKLYNTLTGKKESFRPISDGAVSIYGCGPTVYGYTHVGNARAALSLDLVVRSLEFLGYKVNVARNFTDVDDKIIATAQKEGKTAQQVAEFYINAYVEDLANLKTRVPDHTPQVTQSMPLILQFIEGLIEKKSAYVLKTSLGQDVYFRVSSFKEYGKLSHRKIEEMLEGTRAETESGKEHSADFSLWKAAKPSEPSWESPWGPGRPGWHIECSAMILKLFGPSIDIHMGGIDLIFPHHENEIAQSECFNSKKLANYWLHNGLIELGSEKMSKSLGNIVRTKDFLDRHHPDVLRLLCFQQHYRSPLDFSSENIARTELLIERLYHTLQVARDHKKPIPELPTELKDLEARISDAICDDFNAGKALGFILSAARVCHREMAGGTEWLKALPFLQRVLGLLQEDPLKFLRENRERKLKRLEVSERECQRIEARIQERNRLRAQKDFAASDAIRNELDAEGIQVMDGADGSTWTMKGVA